MRRVRQLWLQGQKIAATPSARTARAGSHSAADRGVASLFSPLETERLMPRASLPPPFEADRGELGDPRSSASGLPSGTGVWEATWEESRRGWCASWRTSANSLRSTCSFTILRPPPPATQSTWPSYLPLSISVDISSLPVASTFFFDVVCTKKWIERESLKSLGCSNKQIFCWARKLHVILRMAFLTSSTFSSSSSATSSAVEPRVARNSTALKVFLLSVPSDPSSGALQRCSDAASPKATFTSTSDGFPTSSGIWPPYSVHTSRATEFAVCPAARCPAPSSAASSDSAPSSPSDSSSSPSSPSARSVPATVMK
mmetsp:Transcript_112798/g.297896  ORF Transcript_112798/g.297896 Transcript_112798/m.297896 type:complete len:315 (-) Transcript_112798:1335-2279(-)